MIKFFIALGLLLGLSNAGAQSSALLDQMDITGARNYYSTFCNGVTHNKSGFTQNGNVLRWADLPKEFVFNSEAEAKKIWFKWGRFDEQGLDKEINALMSKLKKAHQTKSTLLKGLLRSSNEADIKKLRRLLRMSKELNEQIERQIRTNYDLDRGIMAKLALKCYQARRLIRNAEKKKKDAEKRKKKDTEKRKKKDAEKRKKLDDDFYKLKNIKQKSLKDN